MTRGPLCSTLETDCTKREALLFAAHTTEHMLLGSTVAKQEKFTNWLKVARKFLKVQYNRHVALTGDDAPTNGIEHALARKVDLVMRLLAIVAWALLVHLHPGSWIELAPWCDCCSDRRNPTDCDSRKTQH